MDVDLVSVNKFDVSYRNYDDFVVIYNLRTKEIFKFEDVAADILTIINSKCSIELEMIIDNILEIYECDRAEISEDIADFINQLFELGIVMIDGKYCEKRVGFNNVNQRMDDDFEGRIINLIYKKGLLYSMTFEMTYACNERCIHCYANYPQNSDKKMVINIEKYKEIIDELYEMRCMHIAFTGGDPFMYKGFEEIFVYARTRGLVCDIYTNGLYLADNNDVLERIIQLRPRALYISMYGASADVHDMVTTVRGSFDKTVNTVKALCRANISVVLNIMLLSVNCDQLSNIIKLAKQLGAEYRIGMSLIYRNDGDSSPMQYFIDDKDKIKELLMQNTENIYSIDSPIGEENMSDRLCGAGTTTLAISPDGQIYPCISLKMPLGNIMKDTIHSVWNSDKRKNLKELLSYDKAEECKKCRHKKYCAHCPGISLAESGDLYSCNTCDKTIAECVHELNMDN